MSDTTISRPIPVAGMRALVRRHDGGVVVELHGELDLATTTALTAELRGLSYQYDAGQVTLDLTRLDFIDVHGTSTLKQAARMFDPHGRITLRGDAPLLDTLLTLVGCRDTFDVER